MLRRNSLFLVLPVLILLLVTLPAIPSSSQPQVAAAVDFVALTWTGAPQTTQTITWRTDANQTAGQVQFVEAQEGAFTSNAKTLPAEGERFTTNLGDFTLYSVTLSELRPGTRYLYRVGTAAGWSRPRNFTTAAAGNPDYKFLLFGDSQSLDYNVWRTTVQNAYQANPDAAFFINVGDLVDTGQNESEWNGWFGSAQGVIDTIPAMPAPGNHETYTPQDKTTISTMPAYFKAQLKLPNNGPEQLKGLVYSWDYGNVHFTVLDSQVGEEAQYLPNMLEIQSAWLEKDLASTDKLWKIVLMHKPLQSSRGYSNLMQAFGHILDRYHVDVVFDGHDHVYDRTYPIYAGEVAKSPAEGTIYVRSGRSGTKTWKGAPGLNTAEFFFNPSEEPNYLTVEVKGSTLAVKVFKQSGGLLDSWTIEKK